MSLADHWNEGSEWLNVGDHHVVVKSCEMFTANSGTKGVKFVFDNKGAQRDTAFYLTPKALWRLARFAEACGLTQEQCTKYETDNALHHERMIGKECMIRVVKEGKYCEVSAFWQVGSDAPAQAAAPTAQAPVPTPEDDVPF